MKKALFVVALATILVFAFATAALAEVSPGGNFVSWASGGENGTTPHMGFTATSVKCAVCHSVHNAQAVNGAGNQNILLITDSASACTYCHITSATSSKHPYGNDPLNYTNDYSINHGDSSTVIGGYTGCNSCHSVHGANTYTAALGTSILKKTTTDAQIPAAWYGASATADQEMTSFCAQCHAYFVTDYDTTTPGTEGNHVMTTDITGYANHEAGTTANVAYKPSYYCTACHDANDQASFPHYMTGYDRFMKIATDDDDALVGTDDATHDGACLKCHNDSGTAGVGMSF